VQNNKKKMVKLSKLPLDYWELSILDYILLGGVPHEQRPSYFVESKGFDKGSKNYTRALTAVSFLLSPPEISDFTKPNILGGHKNLYQMAKSTLRGLFKKRKPNNNQLVLGGVGYDVPKNIEPLHSGAFVDAAAFIEAAQDKYDLKVMIDVLTAFSNSLSHAVYDSKNTEKTKVLVLEMSVSNFIYWASFFFMKLKGF
jgi:hypothetical protein